MLDWNNATSKARQNALTRPALTCGDEIRARCEAIMADVFSQGDAALLRMAAEYDNRQNPRLCVPKAEIDDAENSLSPALKNAIEQAYANIRRFHEAQLPQDISVPTRPGVSCDLKYQAIDSVGLYVPGGSAPLPSSVLMQGVPSQLSGATTRVICTPVRGGERINPAILYAAKLCGIDTIIECGGAGAIAAMAYGTESVPKVSKLFGPGNAYVTEAKRLAAQTVPGLAIDMPAGPSEVLVIADRRANPEFIAADLLSQAEHGPDSQVVLLCDDANVITATQTAFENQLQALPRADIAREALNNSALILVSDIEQAVEISNEYGPEHLILQTGNAEALLAKIRNAGSVFVGDYTPESAGDYASGTNHVLPTYGYSKVYSSLSLLDFYRTYTVQRITPEGLVGLADAILPLAEAEGLDAHASAVRIRLEALSNDN